jgi:hypothetical protein
MIALMVGWLACGRTASDDETDAGADATADAHRSADGAPDDGGPDAKDAVSERRDPCAPGPCLFLGHGGCWKDMPNQWQCPPETDGAAPQGLPDGCASNVLNGLCVCSGGCPRLFCCP